MMKIIEMKITHFYHSVHNSKTYILTQLLNVGQTHHKAHKKEFQMKKVTMQFLHKESFSD